MMKKVLSKIGGFFGTLFGVLLALLLGVCFVLLLPLDYIKYTRSLYFKAEHKKYKPFAATGVYFDFYNEIAENKLPIQYISNPNNNSLEYGWFIFNKTLILPNNAVEYCSDIEGWFCNEYDGGHDISAIPLEEYLTQEINAINDLLETDVCDKAILLLDADQIENKDKAKQESRFLLYADNRVEVLKRFCEKIT